MRQILWTVMAWIFVYLPLAGQQVEDLGLSREQLEDKMLSLVNQERESHGLPGLGCDPLLREMARAHSRKMIQENALAHDFPGYEKLAQRAAMAGAYFSKVGENVVRSDTFVVRLFHEALLASPEHRENILDREFTHLGVGIEQSGSMYYVTQEFAGLFVPRSGLEAERELIQKLPAQSAGPIQFSEEFESEMQDFCRRQSSLYLEGKTPLPIPDSFGSASIQNLSFIDMEAGRNAITAALRQSGPLYWALGVAFGRSARNPGGIYSMSLLLFPDLRKGPQAADGLDKRLIKALDKIRIMRFYPELNKLATEIASYCYHSRSEIDSEHLVGRFGRRIILVYQCDSLDLIPDDIARKIAVDPKDRSVGVHVLYPPAQGLAGNFFIIAIVSKPFKLSMAAALLP